MDEAERRARFKPREDALAVRFARLKAEHSRLRAAHIAAGTLPDPDKPGALEHASKLVGTCEEMCPEYERVERQLQKELDRLEMVPGTSDADPGAAVKIYRRPAAGRELPLPEEVRPARVLQKTLDYLFHVLLPAAPCDPTFANVQPFLWNRTRAIRQDFIVQNDTGRVAIACHERIARYHILCLHWKGGVGAEGWSEQQELEQLRKTLRSLMEYYADQHKLGRASPNEPEFRAYNLLLHARDPETLREVELLPRAVFRAEPLQLAVQLRALAQRSNILEKRGTPRNTAATLNFFTRYFDVLRGMHAWYLLACLAEHMFVSVRIGAVKALAKAYMPQHNGVPISFLTRALALDDDAACTAFLQSLGIELVETAADATAKINKASVLDEDKSFPPAFSAWVEAKRNGATCQDLIDCPVMLGAQQSAPTPSVPPHIKPATPPAIRTVHAAPVSTTPAVPPPRQHAPPRIAAQHTVPTLPVPARAPAPRPYTQTHRAPDKLRLAHTLAARLLAETLAPLVHRAANDAATHAVHQRRIAQRTQLISNTSQRLAAELFAAPVQDMAQNEARNAAATVFARRRVCRGAWAQWQATLQRARDRAAQATRLAFLREKLDVLYPSKAAPVKKQAKLQRPSEREMTHAYSTVALRRDRLWRRGTFIDALLAHLYVLALDIPPPDDASFTAALCVDDNDRGASWLVRKFALEHGAQLLTVDNARVALLANPASLQRAQLVFFACGHAVEPRLAAAQRALVHGTLPMLMLIAWTRAEVHTACKALHRASWSRIQVLLLDDAAHDADTQFSHTLDALVVHPVWCMDSAPSYDTAVRPLYDAWYTAVGTLARLASEMPNAAHAFALATALTNLFLRDVAAQLDVCAPQLSIPLHGTLYTMARAQAASTPSLALQHAALATKDANSFSLLDYMDHVLSILLVLLARDTMPQIPAADVQEMAKLGALAIAEISARAAPSVPTKRPAENTHSPPNKRTAIAPKRAAASPAHDTPLSTLRSLVASTAALLPSPP
ncbi:actin cytoskeleton and mitosis protein [Malassezia vespertilionis]|uniref:actin cytoskeleton and mitosis protein n=1 Tax=Malassezia vespertilionis TaxID=2020962 RepID=UPI0024B26A88|nr:actin cytoskeleton and mitosis protein [Malassezia vespertilionis]WFD08262.1 actin cytoskeleton and mitosis protein [Malassezia vespertilionis]